ncbi:transposase [Chloroflexota bacterium]
MNSEMNFISDTPGRRSIRLKGYDYTKDGAYFVTACTKASIPYFDIYPELKVILYNEWESLPERFPTVLVDTFVVMPNHIHGILILRSRPDNVGETARVAQPAGSSPAPTIGNIVGIYKSLCVNKWLKHVQANNIHAIFTFWQRNYYEHVIRNEAELNLVREYIILNPLKWFLDSNNPDSIDGRDYQEKWNWLENVDKTKCRGKPGSSRWSKITRAIPDS